MKINFFSAENRKNRLDFIHALSLIVIGCPTTIVFFSLFSEPNKLVISGFEFSPLVKTVILFGLIGLSALNFYSIIFNNFRKATLIVSGGFFLLIALIHLERYFNPSDFELLGAKMNQDISFYALILLIPLSLVNLITGILVKFEDRLPVPYSPFLLIDLIRAFRRKINEDDIPSYSATLLGILTSVFLAIPLTVVALILIETLLCPLFDAQAIREIAWVGFVGAQGSIVSLLMRMKRMNESVDNKKNYHLFLNALFKPFIGLSLAHLSYFILRSEVIKISGISGVQDIDTYVFIAFISGFTERIGGDYLPKTKDQGTT